MNAEHEAKWVRISEIVANEQTQARAQMYQQNVNEYRETIEKANKGRDAEELAWPFDEDVIVFFDGNRYFCSDGHHRLQAAKDEGWVSVPCEVRRGGAEEALLYALGCNARHGIQRKNEDKRRSVEIVLAHPKWSKWSDNQIAEICRVSNKLVATVKSESSWISPRCDTPDDGLRTCVRNGKEYTIDTTNIGKSAVADLVEEVPAAAPVQSEHVAEASAVQPGQVETVSPARREKADAPTVVVQTLEDCPEGTTTAAPLADAVGNIVPPQLRDMYADPTMRELRAKVEAIIAALKDCRFKQIARRLSSINPFLDPLAFCDGSDEIEAKLDWLASRVEFAIHYALCPRCRGRKCKSCRQLGLVPRSHHHELTNPPGVPFDAAAA